ncbi:hypothetical protein QuyetLC_26870 [Bacillus anthracis]|uniref:Protein kinase domain-containing protein n=1 Tax=Bacillus anthracis TaxID=1392 RepID=A0A640MLC6_BACAN|nr:hypothetical protein QuyetLC_26870 [Bacillus anthracis]
MESIGKYRILSELSNSINSTVFIVEDNDTRLQYVLKQIKCDGVTEESLEISTELFLREKEALTQLNHEHIISLVDSFKYGNDYVIVTEYNPNLLSLEKVIPNLSFRMKCEMVLDLLEGVSCCHGKGIIHRDLKPDNILVAPDVSELKIIDFGVSKLQDNIRRSTTITLREMITQPFASPEQKKFQNIKEESDIYSLGIIIHFIFSNKVLNNDPYVDPEEIKQSNIPDELKLVVLKATKLARADRYTSVDSFYEAFKEAYRKIDEKEEILKLIFPEAIVSRLYNLGKISSEISAVAEDYIKQTFENTCNIYLSHKGKYFLVGNEVEFELNITKEFEVKLCKVNNLTNDYKKKMGVPIRASIEVSPAEWKFKKENNVEYIEYLRERASTSLRKYQEKMDTKSSMSNIMAVWDDELKKRKQQAFNRTDLGGYISLSYDEDTNIIEITLDQKIEFEEDDKIQLVNKNGKKVIIGEYYKTQTDNRVQVIAAKSFSSEEFNGKGKIGVNNYYTNKLNIRFSSAMDQVLRNSSINRNLFDILNFSESLKLPAKMVQIGNKVNPAILDETMKIIEKALSTDSIYLIQGPPGTGKTTLISELIAQIYLNNPTSKILFVSPSHVAVDHATNNIKKSLNKINSELEKRIVRIGNEKKISLDSESIRIENHTRNWAKNVMSASIDSFRKYLENLSKYDYDKVKEVTSYLLNNEQRDRETLKQLINDENSEEAKISTILKDWYIALSNNTQFEYEVVKNALMISSTCSGVSSYESLDETAFEWVIIDEAARATVPELLIPMVRGSKFILVGDHKQLPPIVNVDSNGEIDFKTKKILEESLFKDIYEKINPELKSTLSTQFRMHPAISKLTSELFYKDIEIIDHFKDKEYILQDHFKPITWLDTKNIEKHHQTREGKSFKNYAELTYIKQLLKKINDKLKVLKRRMTIGIISGYEAHKNLLTDNIHADQFPYLDMEINNVDAFQGSEKDIIIYSVVRSNNNAELGFLSDERRLNVSLSRAKQQLFIVGNSDVSSYGNSSENPFYHVIKYINRNPKYCTLQD